jgi:hypothetical protein
MSEFTYLFRGRKISGSPEEMQQHFEKWAAWESVRFQNNCRDSHFDGIDEPLSCSAVKQDRFAKLVSSVRMKLKTHY